MYEKPVLRCNYIDLVVSMNDYCFVLYYTVTQLSV